MSRIKPHTRAAGTLAPEPTVPFLPAEKAGWKPHFKDDFQRENLGTDWKILQGDWSPQNGTLRGHGGLVSTRGFPDDSWGFTRLEYEVEIDAGAAVREVESFIHAQAAESPEQPMPWATGYSVRFGGQGDTGGRLSRDNKEVAVASAAAATLVPGQVRRVVVENDQGTIRVFVDEKLVVQYRDTSPLVSGKNNNRIGFHSEAAARLRNVRVYIKRLDDMDHFLF